MSAGKKRKYKTRQELMRGLKVVMEENEQLKKKEGPYYESWKAAMRGWVKRLD